MWIDDRLAQHKTHSLFVEIYFSRLSLQDNIDSFLGILQGYQATRSHSCGMLLRFGGSPTFILRFNVQRQTRNRAKETKGPCGSTETAGVCLELHSGDACSGNSHKHLPFRRFPSPSGCKGGSTLLDDHGCLCWLGPEKSLPPQHSALRAVLLVLLLVLTESAEPSASLVLGESVAVHQR